MTKDQAIAILIEFIERNEWKWEDRGYDYNYCSECGWNTRMDRTPEVALGHRPKCPLNDAMNLMKMEIGQ